MPPVENPYDPRKRKDLSERERIVLEFTDGVLHGDRFELIDRYVSPNYIQHTPGIGQGPDGLRSYVEKVAARRQGRSSWRPIQIFASGDFVILHKLLPAVVIADFFRFDADDRLAEHWDVVQPIPESSYDPLRVSSENFTRFYEMYDLTPILEPDS